MDVFTANYEYDGVFYSVDGNREFHEKLQSDPNFAAAYFRENAAATEIVGVAEGPELEQQEFQWTKKSTALLVHLYKERALHFRDPKQKKKLLWVEIASEFQKHGYKGFTDIVADKKFRNMKKTFRTIKDNNKKTATGRGRISWEYFDEFSEIFQNDATINFGPTIASMPTSSVSSLSSFTPSSCASSAPSQILNQPSTSYTLSSTVSTPSVPSPPLCNNVSVLQSRQIDPNETLTAPSSSSVATKKTRGKKLYDFRKKQLELEERRLEELRRLRESVQRSNEIQVERNNLLSEILKKM